jgi:hypothetical protein
LQHRTIDHLLRLTVESCFQNLKFTILILEFRLTFLAKDLLQCVPVFARIALDFLRGFA